MKNVTVLLFSFISSSIFLRAQEVELFNQGRTRCYYGGMSWAMDGKALFHTHNHVSDTSIGIENKIAFSIWRTGAWEKPLFLDFMPGYSVSYPVWHSKKNRLYFSTAAPLPGRTGDGNDLNIWYADKTGDTWSKPLPANSLNTERNDMLSFIDSDENFYVLNNSQNNTNIYVCQASQYGFTELKPIVSWNSELNEEFVSVYPSLGVAFIQRANPGQTTELFVSQLKDGVWAAPVGLSYDNKTTQAPYVQRWPMLSPDHGTFAFVSQGLIWQQSTVEVLKRNGISLNKVIKHNPLPSKARAFGEPEVFGGLTLKTNNGISFTSDQKTIYLSRYTAQRDSTGRQNIKIFRSDLADGKWSSPKELSLNSGVPFEYHPVLSIDGSKLFFNSNVSVKANGSLTLSTNNIWFAEKLANNTWGEPKVIESLVTPAYDDYVSFLSDGSMYFRSDRDGGKGRGDIYFSRLVSDTYQTPENVTVLNSKDNENDVCVDPRGRFVIFNRYNEIGRVGNLFLLLSVKTSDGWTEPRRIEHLDNLYDFELTPTLSPDGKYFFYEVNGNILRVETQSLFTADEWALVSKG